MANILGNKFQVCPHGTLGKTRCPKCKRISQNKHHGRFMQSHKDQQRTYRRGYWRKKMIGIDVSEILTGMCPICKTTEVILVPDHNYKTGKLRDWICGKCNRALGVYEKWHKEFKSYLRRF